MDNAQPNTATAGGAPPQGPAYIGRAANVVAAPPPFEGTAIDSATGDGSAVDSSTSEGSARTSEEAPPSTTEGGRCSPAAGRRPRHEGQCHGANEIVPSVHGT